MVSFQFFGETFLSCFSKMLGLKKHPWSKGFLMSPSMWKPWDFSDVSEKSWSWGSYFQVSKHISRQLRMYRPCFFLDISGAQVLFKRNRRTLLDLIENGDRWVGNPPKVNAPLCYIGQKQEESSQKSQKICDEIGGLMKCQFNQRVQVFPPPDLCFTPWSIPNSTSPTCQGCGELQRPVGCLPETLERGWRLATPRFEREDFPPQMKGNYKGAENIRDLGAFE